MVKTKANGYRKETAENLLLDAGAIYANLAFDQDGFLELDEDGLPSGEPLGATNGGNEFTVEVEWYQPEMDGVRTSVKGLDFQSAHNAQLVTNLKEYTIDNLKRAIATADVDKENPQYDVIKPRTYVEDTDYIENIAYIGRLSGKTKPVIILLENAISIEGISASYEDEGDNTLPITFRASANAEDAGDHPGYKIMYPSTNGAQTTTLSVETNDFSNHTVAELRTKAKDAGIEGYPSMNKADLIEKLK
ncbi:Rho termination factor N-terminal domain-containing protein [Virgibacillus oceani]